MGKGAERQTLVREKQRHCFDVSRSRFQANIRRGTRATVEQQKENFSRET